MLKSYIWQANKAKIPFSALLKHKSVGGVGLPMLTKYYYAALLDQIKAWSILQDKHWVSIKRAMTTNHNLQSLLYVKMISNPTHTPFLPCISASLEAWRFLIDHLNP